MNPLHIVALALAAVAAVAVAGLFRRNSIDLALIAALALMTSCTVAVRGS